MTDAELDQIAARLAAATPGPWYVETHWSATGWRYMINANTHEEGSRKADSVFVAHAPADLAALLAALREARTIAAAALRETVPTEIRLDITKLIAARQALGRIAGETP